MTLKTYGIETFFILHTVLFVTSKKSFVLSVYLQKFYSFSKYKKITENKGVFFCVKGSRHVGPTYQDLISSLESTEISFRNFFFIWMHGWITEISK